MSSHSLTLSVALSDNERTRPVVEQRCRAQGVTLVPTVVHPSEMFWRQLKYAEFDVSEMSLASLFIAAAKGDRTWVAIPVFTTRYFFHTNILVHQNSGIRTPADLRGKRVGVPEYQQTAALWCRGILQHEFGVHARDIEWFMERGPDRSHGSATGFKPPEGVRLNQIPPSSSIGHMLMEGELDATLLYLASPNLVDRSRVDLMASGCVRTLFEDPAAERRRYYEKTSVYPINHTLVMRRSLYEQHPWIALNLYHAFVAAKEDAERQLAQTLVPYFETGMLDGNARLGLAQEPKPYGMKACRKVIETISQYVHEQGLAPRQVAIEEIFAPSTLEI